MKDFLFNMYYGRINECDNEKRIDNEKTEREFTFYETLEEILPEEYKAIFDAFYELHMNNLCVEKRNLYMRAFKMGFWLAMELNDFEI